MDRWQPWRCQAEGCRAGAEARTVQQVIAAIWWRKRPAGNTFWPMKPFNQQAMEDHVEHRKMSVWAPWYCRYAAEQIPFFQFVQRLFFKYLKCIYFLNQHSKFAAWYHDVVLLTGYLEAQRVTPRPHPVISNPGHDLMARPTSLSYPVNSFCILSRKKPQKRMNPTRASGPNSCMNMNPACVFILSGPQNVAPAHRLLPTKVIQSVTKRNLEEIPLKAG